MLTMKFTRTLMSRRNPVRKQLIVLHLRESTFMLRETLLVILRSTGTRPKRMKAPLESLPGVGQIKVPSKSPMAYCQALVRVFCYLYHRLTNLGCTEETLGITLMMALLVPMGRHSLIGRSIFTITKHKKHTNILSPKRREYSKLNRLMGTCPLTRTNLTIVTSGHVMERSHVMVILIRLKGTRRRHS